MKKRWVEGIIGSSGQYDSDEAKALVSRINNKGNSLWETMVKSDVADREYLQVDEGGKWAADLSRYFRDGFDGLRFIAQAWATPGTDLYGREDVKKELIAGLDHMVDKGYDGEQMIGNWWPWQIGGAQRFTDILLLLDSQGALTQQQIEHYTGIINKYDPTPQKQLTRGPKQADGTETWGPLTFSDKESAGGNRLDIAVVVLGTGLLRNDTDRVAMAVKGIEPFMLNTDGNGFRDDGSYVDHESFAYTGGYGESLITALSRILSVTAGTDYAAGDEYATSFGHSLSYGVLPNIYRGIGIPALKGRGLTRKVASGPDAWCNSVVFRLIDLADSMPESDRKEILAASKYWIENSKECFNRKAGSFTDLNAIKKAVEQGETLTSRPAQGAYIYPQMDRFIDREENHVFSLGLYSDRISSYEVGAHENIRGWHFADGMTYLFNGDSMQFLGDYWPTVDPYRLPGTTVDTRALPDDDSSYRERPGKNMDATGGVATDNLSAISQYIDKSDWVLNDNTPNEKSADMDLQATKSWFVFPDRIIALGAGISGTTTGNKDADGADASIETVVDNRIIGDGLYSVTDGTGTDLGGGKNSLDTVIYQPSGDATPIAYRMLDGTQASFKRVDRTGAWNDINQREKHMETVSNTFGTVTIDHGAEAKDASYAYSIEPGATVESLAKEKDADPVKIVSNTADVQSIETTDGSKFAANVFAPDGAKLPQGFKATTRLSVVAEKTAADSYTLTISDPSQKQDYVTIVTPDSVLWATGEGVTYDAATHELKVPTANKKGSAVAVSLTVKPKEEEIPSDGEETTVPTDDGQKSPGTSASVTQSSDSGKTSSGGNLPVIAGGVFGALALLIGVLWTFLGQFPNLIHQMR
nr:polysaccharide lyase family 8 super-sandwich domain-containing protein [Corynebacterium mendelii]